MKVKCHGKGGIFSILGGGLEGIRKNVDVNDISEIYVHSVAHNINPFDHVMIQSDSVDLPSYNVHAANFLNCDDSMLDQYATIVKNIKFKKDLLDLVDYYSNKFQLDDNTVGVHCRITDLNIIHKQYGTINFEHYKEKLEGIIQEGSKIFVSSDNDESIQKLLDIYKDKVTYVPNLTRSKKEHCNDHTNMQKRELVKEHFVKEAFLEVLLLSKCGTFVHRKSTMSVFAKVLRRILGKNNNILI